MLKVLLNKLDKFPIPIFIVIIGMLLFLPFLGSVHLFDWDEINFAESAREMLITGDYFTVQVNFQPFWEKPPLFIWLQAANMKVFGVSEFAARLPNAICGIITLVVLYLIGKRVHGKTFGALWVLFYIGSFLPHFYFKSGVIDPVFNLFIFLGIYYLAKLTFEYEFIDKKKRRRIRMLNVFVSGLFVGLAVLTKGPVAFGLVVLTGVLYFLFSKLRKLVGFREMLVWGFTILIVTTAWYGVEVYKNGIWFLQEFIVYQVRLLTSSEAGHGQPFYYHFVVLLIGCFPASILIFNSFKKQEEDNPQQQNFKRWMICLFLVVLTVFSIVTTKIVHYSSLAYFPITYLATYFAYWVCKERFSWKWYHSALMIFFGVLWSLLLIGLPYIGLHPEAIIEYVKDPFAVANLDALVHWSHIDFAVGIGLLFALLVLFVGILKKRYFIGFAAFLLLTTLVIQSTMNFFVPKIEKYSQAAQIEFFENLQDEDVYFSAIGQKSYAHYFYGRKQEFGNKNFDEWLPVKAEKEGLEVIESADYNRLEMIWMLEGNIDKPAYFSCKNVNTWRYDVYELEELYRKNGFVFYVRYPQE